MDIISHNKELVFELELRKRLNLNQFHFIGISNLGKAIQTKLKYEYGKIIPIIADIKMDSPHWHV